MQEINVLSPELMAIVNNARPKKGQTIHFESLRLGAGGTSVRNPDRIYDPWKVVTDEKGNPQKDGKGKVVKGEYVDIGYVLGQLPAANGLPARWNFGRVQFSKNSGNVISTSGNNRADDSLFLYLFLTNYSLDNKNQPWYAPSEGQMPLFKRQQPALTAKEENDYRRAVRAAGEKIDGTPESKLLDLALALDMKNINEFSDPEEIKRQLYLIAEGDPKKGIRGNPERVIGMDKDINLNMKLFIKEALKYKIWVEDPALRLFVWTETREPVFLMTPGQDLYGETIKYLLGAGERTAALVKGQIDRAKEKEQGKKNYVPPKPGTIGDAIKESIAAGDHIPEGSKIVVNKEILEVKE